MSDYVPTAEDIRGGYAQSRMLSAWHSGGLEQAREAEVEFDRWLEAHDREVAARELREAVDKGGEWVDMVVMVGGAPSVRLHGLIPDVWLRRRADQIEKGSGRECPVCRTDGAHKMDCPKREVAQKGEGR